MIKKLIFAAAALLLLLAAGCSEPSREASAAPSEETGAAGYVTLTPEEAHEAMAAGTDYFLLDVRNKNEYAEKYIAGAVNIPKLELEERLNELPEDKSTTVFIYCRKGLLSPQAGELLASLGYTDVRVFGGVDDWPYELVTPEEAGTTGESR